jgi:hypothetical protein
MKKIRHLHLVGATGTIRTAIYDKREHIVVPVVAMVEGVVWAVNSDVPEFVPAEELAETPYQWNGRGCFAGHPDDDGTQVTANTPRTLEKSFGLVFDAAPSKQILTTRRLELFAWLDPMKADAVGTEAADVIRRLRAGETVEVSVGCYVDVEQKDGTFEGKEYHSIWRSIVSDHLAFLAVDETGACSVAAGCGAGRKAIRHLVARAGDIVSLQVLGRDGKPLGPKVPVEVPVAEPKKLKDRVKAFLKTLQDDPAEVAEETAELVGYNTMSSLLNQAVVALGDANKTVAALLLDENAESTGDEEAEESVEDARLDALRTQCMTVYSLLGGIMEMCWTMQQDEEDDVQSVYVVNAAKRVAADAKTKVEPAALLTRINKQFKAMGVTTCSCGGQARGNSTHSQGDDNMVDKARIKALMENVHNPLKDQKALEAAGEDAIKALEAHCKTLQDAADKLAADAAAAKKIADDEAAAKLAAAAAKPATTMTEEEALKMFPRIASVVNLHQAREAAEKDVLVASLKTCGVKTEAELKAMPLDELKTMAAFAKVAQPAVDFSGMGVARPPVAGDTEDLTPPSTYAAGLKAMREKKETVVA